MAQIDCMQSIVFSIQAGSSRLKELFRKKDEVEAIVKQSGIHEDSFSHSVYHAIKFYKSEGGKFLINSTKNQSHFDHVDENPVIRLYLHLSSSKIKEVKDFLQSFNESSKNFDHQSDSTYRLLDSIFDCVIHSKPQFHLHLESDFHITKNIATNCLICGDPSETQYCDTTTCLKCKVFFQDLMRQRTLLSLRCSKNGNCFSTYQEGYDLSCRKCRYDRCKVANMVELYCFSELPVLLAKSCLICQTSDEGNEIVLGYSLCGKCREVFDQYQRGQALTCVEEPQSRCATLECAKCAKAKMAEYGLIFSFKMRTESFQETPSCFRPTSCCVCFQNTSDFPNSQSKWMDLVVCLECRAFLKASLDHESHILYCCPRGEVGRLCPINQGVKCTYCWFLRCELEGLVERWQICNGDPAQWSEIIRQIEHVSDEES